MLIFLYRVYFVLIVPLLAVWSILCAIVAILLSACGLKQLGGYWVPVAWAKVWCWLTFVRVKAVGRENISKNKAYVFVANHQGQYDIYSIYAGLGHNFRWMMKKALEKIPVVGYSCRVSGQIYVDTSSRSNTRQTMETAKRQIASGMSVVVFPEGSRSYDGRVQRFKKGAFTLAEAFNLPVVPITIDGSYEINPRTERLPRPGRIVLTIHKPIEPDGDAHDMDRLMELSREAIISALPEKHK
ncbi:MAG: 1-acyl-sn-glycerol-3-phosphate acyltransferase [Muribaculaceae bacterium]|nr:1-acyl-sn-glycerol-3-phosphate acyltransferase [Muribaculaceae bacterium]